MTKLHNDRFMQWILLGQHTHCMMGYLTIGLLVMMMTMVSSQGEHRIIHINQIHFSSVRSCEICYCKNGPIFPDIHLCWV